MLNKVVFLLIVVTVAFALCGCEGDMIPQPTTPEPLVNPLIDLISNPMGATVEFFRPDFEKDISSLGEVLFVKETPVIDLELEPGSYVLRFSAEGHDAMYFGMSLAYGDTNVSHTIDLRETPPDSPEYDDASGYLSFSGNPIILGETVRVTATINSGVLGILSFGGQTHFSYAGGAYVFPFKPEISGEHIVSLLIIGEGGDFLPINEFLTVLPGETEEVTLNAWVVGDDTAQADSEVRFGWAASANADSVTTDGYYTDGNIGLSGESGLVILQDHVVTFYVWKDGEIKDVKSLEFFVRPPEPMPMPELTFFASAYEVENDNPMWSDYMASDGEQIFLVWNVKYYDELTDEVGIDRMPTYGDFGPRGLVSVIASSDTTFTMTVYRNGQEVMSKMVRITIVDGPIEQPELIRLGWGVNVWVGQRAQDPHEADLMSSIYLPTNLQIAVSAQLEYSPASAGQDDEACRIGFLSDQGEHWALNSSGEATFPDQGEGINQMFDIGTVRNFSNMEGRMVIQSVGREGKCTNPNSVHCSWIELEIRRP